MVLPVRKPSTRLDRIYKVNKMNPVNSAILSNTDLGLKSDTPRAIIGFDGSDHFVRRGVDY